VSAPTKNEQGFSKKNEIHRSGGKLTGSGLIAALWGKHPIEAPRMIADCPAELIADA